MVLVPHSPFLTSLKPIKTSLSQTKTQFTFNNLKVVSSLGPLDAEENPLEVENDPIKLAFSKANAYKKSIQSNSSNPVPKIVKKSVKDSGDGVDDEKNNGLGSQIDNGEGFEVPLAVNFSFEKAKEYKKDGVEDDNITMESSEGIIDAKRGDSTLLKKSAGLKDDSSSDGLMTDNMNSRNQEVPLAVKLALEKAKKYKENKGVVVSGKSMVGSEQDTGLEKEISGFPPSTLQKIRADTDNKAKSDELKSDDEDNGSKEVTLAVKLALEKAKKYKEDKGVLDSGESVAPEEISGQPREVGLNPPNTPFKKKADKKEELRVSSMDFVGLGFSDKKMTRGLPAGLIPVADSFPEGALPEVEILVGDTSKFGDGSAPDAPTTEEDQLELYKPKVSTWGVFPRPNNISKTFGGGRNIRPGELLETAENKAAKDARTRQLIAAYNTKIGMNIDPKLKAECEKALKDGDTLMDLGKLKEALPFYEKVMDKLAFQTELYGLAALQWSICQDSLSKQNEARLMYEKLQSHPKVQVSKKARQFMFGFQAMEMMKVNSMRTSSMSIGYRSYFEAFVREKTSYSSVDSEVDEGALTQIFPYILLLLSPVLVVLIIAVQKGGTT